MALVGVVDRYSLLSMIDLAGPPSGEERTGPVELHVDLEGRPFRHRDFGNTDENFGGEADLATVIQAWPTVIEVVKTGIVAMVRATAGCSSQGSHQDCEG